MSHSQLTLFVSSTCYDLAQVRENISHFCTSAGITPLVSEQGNFPVDPSVSAIDNCLMAVRERADIFLLVVGGRYGSLNDAGKSITNLEYLEAQVAQIPKYVFVKREVLALLPIWQANPESNFSSAVDSPKLFEFIASLRNSGEVWVFPFDSATDLITTLRVQLSHLFLDSLKWRKKLRLIESNSIATLDPISLKHFAEKNAGWEYLCLASLLKNRIERLRPRKLDLELGISLGPPIKLDDTAATCRWISTKMGSASLLVSAINPLFANGVPAAMGAPGEPGDIERIEHFANRVAELQSLLIEWTLEFYRLDAPQELERVLRLSQMMTSEAIAQIEEYSLSMYGKIDYALKHQEKGSKLELTLKVTAPDNNELLEELQRLQYA